MEVRASGADCDDCTDLGRVMVEFVTPAIKTHSSTGLRECINYPSIEKRLADTNQRAPVPDLRTRAQSRR